MGGGFLYTNQESLSLGIVVGIHSLNQREPREEVYKFLDEFKDRPEIKNLTRVEKSLEYSAHLISEGGIHIKPKVYGDGILITGDAAWSGSQHAGHRKRNGICDGLRSDGRPNIKNGKGEE